MAVWSVSALTSPMVNDRKHSARWSLERRWRLLLSRRLVDAGIPVIQANMGKMNTWDTHTANFKRLKNDLLPPFDQGLSALLQDLEDRGLLETTLVVAVGEFGRTPTINKDAGRDHWSGVFSAVKAAAPTGDDSLSEVPFEQQLARATSESANVDLETALQLTWELLETLCAIMAHGKVSIRWARRGEMIPSRDSEDVTYQFRTYSTFGSTPSTSVPAKRTTASQLTRKTGSQTANRGCLVSTLSLITYITFISLVVISVLALTIPLASGYQLLSSPPHKSGIAWFTMLLGMAICVAPCRISYSATSSYWRQKRRR